MSRPVLPSDICCSAHKEEKLTYWCETCSIVACKQCATTHSSHSTALKDVDLIYTKIPAKSSLESQLANMHKTCVDITELYNDFDKLAFPFLADTKNDQLATFHNTQTLMENALKTARDLYNAKVTNPDMDISEIQYSKFRIDDTTRHIHMEIQQCDGFQLSIEPYIDEEFFKIYRDAYTNRTKDFAMTNILADKLLRIYPLNLQALSLKAEAREGHDLFKFIVKQPCYDEYDEFAIAEAFLYLKQKQQAYSLYVSSSDKGCMYSQHKLGTIYFNGDPELKIPQNKKEALNYFLKAAGKGLALSQYNIGYCYYLGDGVPKDKQKAVSFYRMAAEQGYAVAEYKLGHCFENAIGVEENYDEAEKWYKRAAQKGHDGAMSALDLLMSKVQHEKEEKEKVEREEKERQNSTKNAQQTKRGWFGTKK
jgi:TPR repeat protein